MNIYTNIGLISARAAIRKFLRFASLADKVTVDNKNLVFICPRYIFYDGYFVPGHSHMFD